MDLGSTCFWWRPAIFVHVHHAVTSARLHLLSWAKAYRMHRTNFWASSLKEMKLTFSLEAASQASTLWCRMAGTDNMANIMPYLAAYLLLLVNNGHSRIHCRHSPDVLSTWKWSKLVYIGIVHAQMAARMWIRHQVHINRSCCFRTWKQRLQSKSSAWLE